MASLAVIVPAGAVAVPPGPELSFEPPVRLGASAGDDWEPAIAAGEGGHLYVMWKHYDVAGDAITACGDPTACDRRILVQTSSDGGATFGGPIALDPGRIGYDSQIATDPLDRSKVYGAFLVGTKSSIGFVSSPDGGTTWSPTIIVEPLAKATDKDILAVRGRDVYIAYNSFQKTYVSSSHDGGRTWSTTQTSLTAQGKLGWALPGGGTVTPNGDVFFAWAGFERNGGAKGPVNLYVTRSTDGGATWRTIVVDRSETGPTCNCDAFAFYSAQMTIAGDETGRLHVLYNFNDKPYGPGRMLFRTSDDRGLTWGPARDVSAAPAGANNVFPAIATAGTSDVRVAWMDNRTGAFKVYLRASSDGGTTWGPEAVLSADLAFPYQSASGFVFPYGDYFEVEITPAGKTVAVWGEGPSFDGPGNIFFAAER
jgi:hypothetical protein